MSLKIPIPGIDFLVNIPENPNNPTPRTEPPAPPAAPASKEALSREEISLIESEALAVGWEPVQLDELARCIRVYMPNCGIGEVSLRAIQVIHFYPDGTIRSYVNFYNMRVPQPWIKKTPPTGE